MEITETEMRDYILEKIIRHEFPTNKKLPSENELADYFGTTRNRIRKVYQMLEAMGYITSKQGIGHFPREKGPTIELALRGDISFSEKMKQQGIAYQSINIHCLPIQLNESDDRQQLFSNEGQVYEICRLRIVHGKPAAGHYSYVSTETFPNIAEDGKKITSIFNYYFKKGFSNFTSSGSELSISFPQLEEQRLLKCGELVPLLIMKSDCRDKKTDKLLEITKIIYRSDLFKYKIEID